MISAKRTYESDRRFLLALIGAGTLFPLLVAAVACASTYVVNIPLDSPIYFELETLNGLGYLDTYFGEIKPISRIEAARLTLEAQENVASSDRPDLLAQKLVTTLKMQLADEIGWLETDTEDNEPTTVHALDRVETQYVYSSGSRRYWNTGAGGVIQATEGTPLLPNNDGLATSAGSNEIIRLSGWAGFGGFLTGYSEGAISGPMTYAAPGASRAQLLGTEVVASLGNVAISFGQSERSYGTGYFSPLSQGNNALPFPALSVTNVHPTYLPWILRYLGPGRREFFFGQLDADKPFAQHPWIVGHAMVFKPLPTFELGLTRTMVFGGRYNDHYDVGGFFGRFTGLGTGDASVGNTNSRGGVFLKFYFPGFRNTQVYQEMLGEDNLTAEVRPIGRYLPFFAVSYQGGVYVPRLTEDGLTDLRFEYALLEPNYSIHDQGLYWTYHGEFMGDPLGPNATKVDVQVGRWFSHQYKLDTDFFYTEQASNFGTNTPYSHSFYPYNPGKEHSFGIELSVFSLPGRPPANRWLATSESLIGAHAKFAAEYVENLNYRAHSNSFRMMLMLSGTVDNPVPGWNWH